MLLSPGTINSLRGVWDSRAPSPSAGEGNHSVSRRAAIADDKFLYSPKNPTHKKGFVRNHLAFFFFN